MARKSAATGTTPRKSPKRARKSGSRASSSRGRAGGQASSFSGASAEQMLEMARMANLLTPEQAIELYKANARMALDVINAAIDSTAKLRKLQFEGEESARELGRRTARGAAEARDAQSLVALGQDAGREALEKSLAYWREMFELITEIQKRLFSLLQEQAEGLPGVKQAKAAMVMMPDLTPMKNVVNAMQGLIGSGSSAIGSMQRMLADMARMAQTMSGTKR